MRIKSYKNIRLSVLWGPKLRLSGKGKEGHQNFDFVIVDLDLKANIRNQDRVNADSK